MKIAFISEGQTEYTCLPLLYAQLREATGNVLLNPICAQIPPLAASPRIAKECLRALKVVAIQKPDLVIVLLDRETSSRSAGQIAAEIENIVESEHDYGFAVRLVVKDRMFENWLIADVAALAAQPRRYEITEAMRRRVEPNKADAVSALEFLKRAARNRQYDKVGDGRKTAARLNIRAAGANSRSFRHFLHVVGHPDYADQCKRPAVSEFTG